MSVPTNDENSTRPDPEVKPTRRILTPAYKQRILGEINATPGDNGMILRRENLWSSQISAWRKQAKSGTLGGTRRGRKGKDPVVVENEQLRDQVDKLKAQLAVAEEIMEAQGKVSAFCVSRMSGRNEVIQTINAA